jgi:two-component system KDP operon response regulator KdpE
MTMGETVLVVDDEPPTVRLVSQALAGAGYRVISASSGQAALETLALEQPDLVLLDILLPQGPDGYEVCRRLREFSSVPVVMLTAKVQEADLLRGFDAGADDYLRKPFSVRELLARVRAVLRRAARPEEAVTAAFTCGELEINFARRAVTMRGAPVSLTATEYALLRELALNAGRVMLHRELLTKVWGPGYAEDVYCLRAYIHYLRRKLEADPSNPRYILTSQGVGYSLISPDQVVA